MKATKKGIKWFLMGMLAIIAAFGLMVAGCDDGKDNDEGGGTFDSALVGTWVRSDSESGYDWIDFTPTGSGMIDGDNAITATTSGTTIRITDKGSGYTIEPLTYAIAGTTLTISGGTSAMGGFFNGTYTKQSS